MNTCKDCEWWSAHASGLVGDCDAYDYTGTFNPTVAHDGIAIATDETAGLVTCPDFGCVHWTAKKAVMPTATVANDPSEPSKEQP